MSPEKKKNAERKEKQRLMGRGPGLEARKKSSEDGTTRDQRSEWEKRWKNFSSQEGENSQKAEVCEWRGQRRNITNHSSEELAIRSYFIA